MEATGRLGQQIARKSEEVRNWPVWARPLSSSMSSKERLEKSTETGSKQPTSREHGGSR